MHRYRSIVKETWYRHFCAVVTSTFQMMGCILYLGAEWHVGFIHLPTNVSQRKEIHASTINCLLYVYTGLEVATNVRYILEDKVLLVDLCRVQFSVDNYTPIHLPLLPPTNEEAVLKT